MLLFTVTFLTLITYIYLSVRYWYFSKPLEPIEQNEITISQTKHWKNDFMLKYFEPSPFICTECSVQDIKNLAKTTSFRWEYVSGNTLTSVEDLKTESLQVNFDRKGVAWTVYVQDTLGEDNYTTVRIYYTGNKYTDILLRSGHSIFIPKKMLKWELIAKRESDEVVVENTVKIQTFIIYDYLLLGVLV